MRLTGVFLIVVAVLVFTRLARADPEDILVRSGDHADFSRLVLYFDQPVPWILRNEQGLALIEFPTGDYRFRLQDLFQRIGRNRLKSVEQIAGENTLSLTLTGDHHVVGFEAEGQQLVLDIKPGKAPASVTRRNFADIATTAETLPDLPEQPLPLTIDLAPDMSPRVQAAQDSLVRELGEALAQGLLTPSRNGSSDSPPRTLVDPELKNHLNLDAKTAYEKGQTEEEAIPMAKGDHCLPDSAFDLSPSPPGEDFRATLGALRRNLVSEIDEVEPEKLDNLVRFLLGNGFGAEARAVLATYPEVLEHTGILRDMADILDEGKSDGPALAAQSDCPGLARIWALLAEDVTTPVAGLPHRALEADFAQMPAAIRQRIGPMLVLRLLDRGAGDLARSIRDRVDRAPGDVSRLAPLIEQRMGAHSDANASPMTALPRDELADALVLQLTGALAGTDEIATELIEDAGNLAFELRYSAKGQALRRLEILALARNGEFGTAFALLSHESVLEALSPETASDIAAAAFAGATGEQAKTGEFVEAYFRFRALLKPEPRFHAARLNVADLMLSVGLPNEAERVLAPMMRDPDAGTRRLAARVELARGAAETALLLLDGDFTPQAQSIRFSAFVALEQYEKALALPRDATDPETRAFVEWQAEKAARGEGEAFDQPLSLADLRESLKSSLERRNQSLDLLQSHPSP